MSDNTKDILVKLFKIASNQQKILEKLAQSTDQVGVLHKNPYNPSDPASYGKLAPNDPRHNDPLYGGEKAPEEVEKEQQGQVKQTTPVAPAPTTNTQPSAKPVDWLRKYLEAEEAKENQKNNF